jgi:hypothetical protein
MVETERSHKICTRAKWFAHIIASRRAAPALTLTARMGQP